MSVTEPPDEDPNVPVGVDPTRASVARVYDYLLGGKENYEVDRQTARDITHTMPDLVHLATENRAFLERVTRFLAGRAGVKQYLDCGSGLPTAENTHQIVQRIQPDAKVVYVDNDPVVAAHGRVLLEEDDQTWFAQADIFDPDSILDHPAAYELDWGQPIGLLQCATLHHYKGDRQQPAEVMRRYVDALPRGSWVGLSHILEPENEDSATMAAFQETVANGSLGGVTARSHAEIRELFAGCELAEPGLVRLVDWWPNGPRWEPLTAAHRLIVGAVAYKA